MGRGRAKAKQTKVARELKYRSTHTDFSSLQRELRGDEDDHVPAAYADLVEDDEEADPDEYDGAEDADEDEDYETLRRSG